MSLKNKIKLIILIHEGGAQTNLQAIKEAIKKNEIKAEISAVISDQEDALPIIERILPDYVCLCGWRKIIPKEIIKKYENKILNLHPGLIPDSRSLAYGKLHKQGFWKNPDGTEALWNKGMYGNRAIQNFLDKKATYAGASIHFLTSDFDFGPVLGRTFEKIETNDTIESLYYRLKKKENELYVKVLSRL